ncbi:MAG: c-type cytochrome [Acidobacteria bacterium]|nr:c-type cytochrome [Acidobacteriota bacterium]
MKLTAPLAITALLAASSAFGQPKSEAEKLYLFNCAFCHGKGDDGFAANLASPKLPHAPTEGALVNIIKNGIPGTDMPAALGMTDAEIAKVAAYVRAIGRSAPAKAPGNAANGQKLYTKNGCVGCHMVGGQGGKNGPDLTDIGLRRSLPNLAASLTKPEAAIAAGWTAAEAVAKDGTKIAGVRLSEDAFSINIRDDKGKIHLLRKSQLTSSAVSLGKSLMPAYDKLSESDLNDLVAYLFSLRGE